MDSQLKIRGDERGGKEEERRREGEEERRREREEKGIGGREEEDEGEGREGRRERLRIDEVFESKGAFSTPQRTHWC